MPSVSAHHGWIRWEDAWDRLTKAGYHLEIHDLTPILEVREHPNQIPTKMTIKHGRVSERTTKRLENKGPRA